MIVKKLDHKTATIELDLEAVEFIADYLPQGDGFTFDWRNKVYVPMLRKHDAAMGDPWGGDPQ